MARRRIAMKPRASDKGNAPNAPVLPEEHKHELHEAESVIVFDFAEGAGWVHGAANNEAEAKLRLRADPCLPRIRMALGKARTTGALYVACRVVGEGYGEVLDVLLEEKCNEIAVDIESEKVLPAVVCETSGTSENGDYTIGIRLVFVEFRTAGTPPTTRRRSGKDQETLASDEERINKGWLTDETVPKSETTEHARATPIQLEEITQAKGVVDKLQAAVVARVQALLSILAGRRGSSEDENKKIAALVYEIARNSGTEIAFNGQPIHLRWHGGVFEARAIDASRRSIGSSADFPQLDARAKVAGKESFRTK